jgi:hypothetical protein
VKVAKKEWAINGGISSFVARPIKEVKAHFVKNVSLEHETGGTAVVVRR